MGMLAGTRAATRMPNTQADIRCRAQPWGSRLSWGSKWTLPFFLNGWR